MTDLRNQRRMASQVLGVGETSVWLDPLHAEDIAAAVTRADIRGLVDKGHIAKLQAQGVSRGRARALALSKAKGKRKGPGSREGSSTSQVRNPSKQRWMRTIRPIRQTLHLMRDEELIDTPTYRRFYRRAKGGVFRSRPHLLSHMVTEGLLNDQQAADVRKRAEEARAASFGKKPLAMSRAKAATRAAQKKRPPKAAKKDGEQ
jgi:large subunit ribosomal protein L19e